MRKALMLILAVGGFLILAQGLAWAEIDTSDMGNYCIQPPYVSTNIPPNIHILMDNSWVNGSYAYGDTIEQVYGATENSENFYDGLIQQDPVKRKKYDGPFNPNLFYTEANRRFEPDKGVTPNDPNGDGKPGIYDGNMLNWAVTSRYDLITSILMGGKGTPRVTGNTLESIRTAIVNSDGTLKDTWPIKRYRYTGTDGKTKNCQIIVDAAGVTFRDFYGPTGVPIAGTCGIVYGIGPASYSAYAVASAGPVGDGAVALAGLDASEGSSRAAASGPDAAMANAEADARAMEFARQQLIAIFSALIPDDAFAAPALKMTQPPSGGKADPRCTDGKGSGIYANCTILEGLTIDVPITPVPLAASGGDTFASPAPPYNWQIVSTEPPQTKWNDFKINIDPGTGAATFSGTPEVATKTTNIVVRVTDSKGGFVDGVIVLDPTTTPPPKEITIQNFTICGGDYTVNCKTAPAGTDIKKGLLNNYWSKAYFGIINFQTSYDAPNQRYCPGQLAIDQSFPESFGNEIANAQPIGLVASLQKVFPTWLIEAETIALTDFASQTMTPGACSPIAKSTEACQKHFVLMLTAGEGAEYKEKLAGTSFMSDTTACDKHTDLLVKDACIGARSDYNSTLKGIQNVSTYVVNMMGKSTITNTILQNTAKHGGGRYFEVKDPRELQAQLEQAFTDMIRVATSGTAASVLASGEGSGANLIQAVYYPARKFRNTQVDSYDEITWIGRLTNFWYYVDPFFANNNIREESTAASTPILNLMEDPVVELYYNTDLQTVRARRFSDTDGDGGGDTLIAEKDFESVGSLWEAGRKLWLRDLSAAPRKIYVRDITKSCPSCPDGISKDLIALTNSVTLTSNSSLQKFLGVASQEDADRLVRFMHGEEVDGLRSRAVKLDLDGDGETSSVVDGVDESIARVWKLGDVLNSTPRLTSWVPLHKYNVIYKDKSYWSFTNTTTYKNRGVVFAGGNDGMIHAFNLGTLVLDWEGRDRALEKAIIYDPMPDGKPTVGEEAWTFIPTSVLPYLKYLTDMGYCHLYSVDMSPYIFDASIAKDEDANAGLAGRDPEDLVKGANSWRTIMIGGMRFGGACKNKGSACTMDANGDGAIDSLDCVTTPSDSIGFSSYFALDITDTTAPKLMWEFTHPSLGFATTGPVIVRANGDQPGTDADGNNIDQSNLNGKWFVVFGSGPTGPIKNKQFMARSDQSLKFFVFDIATDPMDPINLKVIDTGIKDAYAGSMVNVTNDLNLDYQDDIMYVGYVKKCIDGGRATAPACTDGKWNDGGVIRVVMAPSTNPEYALDPTKWAFTTYIDSIGPVASSVARIQNVDKNHLWTFIGTGRYFYILPDLKVDPEGKGVPDDPAIQRHIMGIKDPCYNKESEPFPDSFCSGKTVNFAELTDVTTTGTGAPNAPRGWQLMLDGPSAASKLSAERVITDLLSTSTGLVFVTTFQPYSDECTLGGKSYVWAFKYDTGGAAGALLKGTALMQVSTGSIEKIDLGSAFSEKENRRSSKLEGVPPMAQGFSLFQTPPPVERVLHMIERDK